MTLSKEIVKVNDPLSKEIVKVNDHVLQVVFILFLGTYSRRLGGLGGIKNLNKGN
jgi:hypothetical protein